MADESEDRDSTLAGESEDPDASEGQADVSHPVDRPDPAVDEPSNREREAPLYELRAAIESREGDADAHLADRFLEKRVQEVDSEAIWADLLMESGDAEGALEPLNVEDDGEYQLVSKRLCHRCEYFGDPPKLHCTHDGTTIHQVVDTEQFRVSNCPMIDRTVTREGEK